MLEDNVIPAVFIVALVVAVGIVIILVWPVRKVESAVGHGHVNPNADGSVARCGGPALCTVCALERCRICNESGNIHCGRCNACPGAVHTKDCPVGLFLPSESQELGSTQVIPSYTATILIGTDVKVYHQYPHNIVLRILPKERKNEDT